MKRFLPILSALLLAALCLSGCHNPEREARKRQVVLLYLAGNNSLSGEGQTDYSYLKQSWLPQANNRERIFLVYHHFTDQNPVLLRLYQDRKGNSIEEIIMEYPFETNSADPQTLTTVLADAENAWPAARHGLILWSHASGFLPAGYYSDPKEKAGGASLMSFGEDHGTEMELEDLRKALSHYHYEFILFDCCLMANVEVAYELRNCCDYMVFSPTEILSDGFPYESIIQPLFSLPAEESTKQVCKSYMELYRAQSGLYQSATITLVKTAGLNQLAAACKPIFQAHRDQILTIDRSQIQPYFRFNKHWYYDIDDFVGRLATDAEYRTFLSALNQTVIYKDATESFLSIDITHYSGLSIYIPRPEYTVLNNFYKTLQWNQTTGLVQ
ncbi:MAG: hypothetical protein IKX34_04415 [Bacteroidales bacterium]|nr:hypothetical protein [Bacteroidales bacterium]